MTRAELRAALRARAAEDAAGHAEELRLELIDPGGADPVTLAAVWIGPDRVRYLVYQAYEDDCPREDLLMNVIEFGPEVTAAFGAMVRDVGQGLLRRAGGNG